MSKRPERSSWGIIRHPRDWLREPGIAHAANAGGWGNFGGKGSGNLTLLEAIIAVESGGDSLAASGSSMGLTQFNPNNLRNLYAWHRGKTETAMRNAGLSRPQGEAGWFNDPRPAVVYAGVILNENLAELEGRTVRVGKGRVAASDNLFLALQGYNGGPDDLRQPNATNEQSRTYPVKVAAYLSVMSDKEEGGGPYTNLLQRLREDAAKVGQGSRIQNGTAQFERWEARMRNPVSDGKHPHFEGTVQPSPYLMELASRVRSTPSGDIEQIRSQLSAALDGIKGNKFQLGSDLGKDIQDQFARNRDLVKAAQMALTVQHFDPHGVDGGYGKNSKSAADAYVRAERSCNVKNPFYLQDDHRLSLGELRDMLADGLKALPPKPAPQRPGRN